MYTPAWLDPLREWEHDAPVMRGTDSSAGINVGCLLPPQWRVREDVEERIIGRTQASANPSACTEGGLPMGSTPSMRCASDGSGA